MDLPLLGMDYDACKYTTCPVAVGKQQKYKYDLLIAKSFPAATYDVKYKLINDDNDKEQCCILIKIKIVR